VYKRQILSHGWNIVTDIKPESLLEKTLYAMDELTGLVATSALVRPSRSVIDMNVKSVRKKWNDKRFAAGVDRSIIERGAAMLGVEVTDLIEDCIMGMRDVAKDIGLYGEPAV
jgi:predicted hydrolase (HD superfamily)